MESLRIAKQIVDLFFAYEKDKRNGVPVWKDDGFWLLTIGLIGYIVARITGVNMPADFATVLAGYVVAIVTDLCGPTVGFYPKSEPKPVDAGAVKTLPAGTVNGDPEIVERLPPPECLSGIPSQARPAGDPIAPVDSDKGAP